MINQQVYSPCAPVVLFVYNRPVHTRQTVESLAKNLLAEQSDLHIFSDAAKCQKALPAVNEVREYLRTVTGFKTVTIFEQEKNLGLAASIISGVTSMCEKYGRVIVLEDDLETSPYFLNYMNDALTLYKDEQNVMHVSGSTYPVSDFCHQESYFLNLPLCWGWATWDRAWSAFSKDVAVIDEFTPDMVSKLNFDDTYNYWSQLELNRDGEMDTWFIFWYVALFLANGLSLFPKRSFVKNIGMDGTGVHCGITNVYDLDGVASEYVKLRAIPLMISDEAFIQHKVFFKSISPQLYYRIKRKITRMFRSGQ